MLITGIFSAATRAGIFAVTGESVEQYKTLSTVVRNNKIIHSTVLGDICDRNEEYILKSSECIADSTASYDEAYTYLLGSVYFDTTGILSTQFDTLTDKCNGNKGRGIRLTIDDELQKQLYQMTKNSRKSIVVMEKNSGKILTMTSAYEEPFCFDEPYSEEEPYEPVWLSEALNCDHTGSTMKLFTAAAAYDSGYGTFTTEDNPSAYFNGKSISNVYGGNGDVIDMKTAFEHSSNVYYSTLGVTMGAGTVREYIDRFLLDKTIPTDFGILDNQCGLKRKPNHYSIASFCYGQGGTYSTVTLCMIVQGALTGKIYRPHIIDGIFRYDEEEEMVTLEETKEELLSDNIVSPETCQAMEQLMLSAADVKGLASDVGVKTGTAELHLGNRANMIGVCGNYVIAISEIDDVISGSSHVETMRTITDILRQY